MATRVEQREISQNLLAPVEKRLQNVLSVWSPVILQITIFLRAHTHTSKIYFLELLPLQMVFLSGCTGSEDNVMPATNQKNKNIKSLLELIFDTALWIIHLLVLLEKVRRFKQLGPIGFTLKNFICNSETLKQKIWKN